MYRLLILIGVIGLLYIAYDAYGYRYYLSNIYANADPEMVIGNPEADINIVAYMDYDSAASRRLYSVFLGLLSTERNVKILLRPIETDSRMSKLSTRIILAAEQQKKFIEISNFLLTNSVDLDENYIKGVMRTMNLNYNFLKNSLNSNGVKNAIEKYKSEMNLLGVNTLPYFFINHVRMPGASHSVAEIQAVIEDIRSGRR